MKKLLALFLMAVICVCALVACGNSGMESAVSNLQQLQKEVKEATPADYEVVGKLTINGDTFTVAWTVDVTEGVKIVVADDGTVTVDVNEYTETEIPYVLTATITAPNGETSTLSFNYKVPAFKELTWAEYMAKADDEAVVIKGVVTAIFNGENEKDIYLQDNDGGYYLYSVTAIPEGLEVGMTIRATGLRDTYQGGAQVAKGATVEILDTNKVEVTPTDITEIVKNAENAKAEDLVKLAGKFVTLNGATVLGQNKGNDTYYDFVLGDVRSYVRISTSNNFLTAEQTDAFKQAVKDNFGKSSTVTGCVSVYGNAIYIVPVTDGAFSNFTVEERDAAGQVAFEKFLLSAVYEVNATGTTDLATALVYKDVTIAWTIKEASKYATINGNKLDVILPPTEQKIVLVATLTSGDATDTKEFEVKLSAAPTSLPEKVESPAAGEENLYKLYLWQNTLKQNLYITGDMDGFYLQLTSNPDEAADVFLVPVEGKDGEYYLCYKVGKSVGYISAYNSDSNGKWYNNVTIDDRHNYKNTWKIDAETGALTTDLVDKDGNPVTVYLGTYSSYKTMSLSTMDKLKTSFPAQFCTLKDMATVSDADKITATKDEITGIPTEITKDGTVTLPLIGKTFSAVEITWTSDNACAVVNGGLLTVTVPTEKATVTLTATFTIGETTDTATYTIEVYVPNLTPAEIVDKAYELAKDGTMGVQTLTGTIIKIDSAYSSQFGNITVTIVVAGKYDKTIQCYRMKGGEELTVGDTITVTGELKKYGENVQFNTGATYEDRKTPADLWDATNAVENKQYLNDTIYTFTGEIVSVNDAYSAQYKNVTVTIKIGEKIFKCFRLSGDGADVIKVGDTITVSGKLQNYNGVQIAQGIINYYPKAMTQAEILAAAAALANNASLPGTHSLTGEVVSIDTAYSAQYGNITVTIKVGDTTIQCYRMKGGDGLAVGDTITVTGEIKKYNNNVQFNTGATYVEAEAEA